MTQKFYLGQRVYCKRNGRTATIREVVKAAYYCYYVTYDTGEQSNGYWLDIDLIRI